MGSEERTGYCLYLKGLEFLGANFTGARLSERGSSYLPGNKKGRRTSTKSCQLTRDDLVLRISAGIM